jgi:serine/threonine protein phosphatase PrpC
MMISPKIVARLAIDGHFSCQRSGNGQTDLLPYSSIMQLSLNDMEVQKLLGDGVMVALNARAWPRCHMSTLAIGIITDEAVVMYEQRETRPGNIIVFVAEGLTHQVEDQKIEGLVGLRSLARLGAQAQQDRLCRIRSVWDL